MPLPREEGTAGLLTELGEFEDLVRSLSAADLDMTTRCEGWTVRDVAAHVIGTMSDIVSGRLEGQGTPEVTQRQVHERRERTADELADELAGARKSATDLLAVFDDAAWAGPSPGGFDFTLGEGIEALWYDAYLHGEDIRAALGRSPATGAGLEASVSHVASVLTRQGWGPAALALDGLREFPVGEGEGDVRRVTGDAHAFVLAATGRSDPAPLGLESSVNIYR